MKLTRVDNKKLEAAVASAEKKMTEIVALLEPYMVILSEAERRSVPKPRSDFAPIGRQIALLLADYPEIAKFAEYDGAAVNEDLSNVVTLERLATPISRLLQMITDSKLRWQAEAYQQTLEGYRTAKSRMAKNDTLARALKPFLDYFSELSVKARAKRTPKSK